MNKSLLSAAISLALISALSGCGGDSEILPAPPSKSDVSTPNANMNFNRVASFPVCSQIGASCEKADATAAEIVTASTDGMTLIYSNSPKGEIGFVDIKDPSKPAAKGALSMGGEPTSVATLGGNVLVVVNTSESFVKPTGKLVVVDIATQKIVNSITLPGQPDSIAVSKDGKYAAIAIENERVGGEGPMGETPAGSLVIVDTVGAANTWKTRNVDLNGIATLYPNDPEPEYISINADNIAVLTLQENNHIVLVDLKDGKVSKSFSAGSVNLSQVDLTDEKPHRINQTETQDNRLREPDGVTWVSKTQFVTANEGDLDGGSRGFSLFNTDGSVAYDSGNSMEHLMARIGHYNDKRSDSKGNEPENAAFGRYSTSAGSTDYLFVCSERSSVVGVYDMSKANEPAFKQVLPAGMKPEGILPIPARNLLIAASEEDDRDIQARSVVNIYQYQEAKAKYPTIESANQPDGLPIPWAALSSLAAANDTTLYSVNDAFFASNSIFQMDVSKTPALINKQIAIMDSKGVLAGLKTSLPADKDANAFDQKDLAAMLNADGTVNIDPEGLAMASDGGFWIASEGAGTVGDKKKPVTSANLGIKTDANGVIVDVITFGDETNAKQVRFGVEGIAEYNGKLYVTFQRAWKGESEPRIGIYDLNARKGWFVFYPLDPVESPNGGWVGLSDITSLGDEQFLVIERDNMGGPDARIKKLYKIDLKGVAEGQTVQKTLVRDILPDLAGPAGNVIEKVEGVAKLPNGNVYILTDNDGVDDSNGETQLINLGKIIK